jgi:hypothetical protein
VASRVLDEGGGRQRQGGQEHPRGQPDEPSVAQVGRAPCRVNTPRTGGDAGPSGLAELQRTLAT